MLGSSPETYGGKHSLASNVYYNHVPFKKKSNMLSLRTKKKKNKTMNGDKLILYSKQEDHGRRPGKMRADRIKAQ